MERTPASSAAELRNELASIAPKVPRWVATLHPPWGPIPPDHREDVVQETLARAAEALARYEPRPGGSMQAWLYTITRRTARELRSREIWKACFSSDTDAENVASGEENAEQSLLKAQCMRLLHETIEELSEDLRDVVVARELAEISLKDTAAVVGLPERTTKDRHERGRAQVIARMRSKLRDSDFGMLRVPIEGIFAFVRGESDVEPTEARPAVPWVPQADPPSLPFKMPWKPLGTFLGGNATGGAVGGAVVYLWMMHASPAPHVLNAGIEDWWTAISPRSAPVVVVTPPPPPQPTSVSLPRRSAVDDESLAKTLLDKATLALLRGDLAGARGALAQHDARFPRAPLPSLRATVAERIEVLEKNRQAP